jgi:hypothetical protein
MITYLTHKEIDFEKYDRCIDLSLNGIVYAYSWYLDMVTDDWDILVEDDYKSVMPLPKRKKFGIHYIYQPFFVQQLGVFSVVPVTDDVCQAFLKAIPNHFRYIDTNLNTCNIVSEHGAIAMRSLPTYELDISLSYGQLRSEYASNTLRNLKKAKRYDLFIARHGRPETIIDTFRQNRGKTLKSFSERDYQVLKHLIYSGIHRGMVTIYSAYTRENNFCAGMVFYRSHNKSILLFSGSDQAARENGAMFLLVDSFIKDHAGQQLVLDFEGSSDKNLARFYSGFGSKEYVFLQIRMNRLSVCLKPAFKIYDTCIRS